MPLFQQHTAASAVVWSMFERFSTQLTSLLIGIVLARLLTPHDYGIVGLTSIFLALSTVFIDSGFANGLIRKVNRTEKDLSTAFYFNIIVGILVYGMLWICSPLIAGFFAEPLLMLLIKIVGLNVVFNSLCIVPVAILTANLNIRIQAVVNLCAQLTGGVIAIYFAYKGFGVYALALQTVISSFLKVLLLWKYAQWRPKERFSRVSFNYLWRFGSKLLGANLIGTLFNHIYSVIIGKCIGKSELGYYAKASSLSSSVEGVSSGIIQKISLPILAKYQNDSDLLLRKFRETMCLLIMVLAPISTFCCFSAHDIVVFLWTEKWLQTANLFQLLIIGVMFNPIGQLSLTLLQVVGRTGVILKLEFPKKFIYCVYIIAGLYYGILGLAIAQVATNVTGSLINMWATKKALPYSYLKQFIDIGKYMLLAFSIGALLSIVRVFSHPILNITVYLIMFLVCYSVVLYAAKDAVFISIIQRLHFTK